MKRFLFIFLCLVVAVSLFVVTAFAAYEGESAAIRFGDATASGDNTVVNMTVNNNYLWSYLEVYNDGNGSLIRDGFVTDWSYSFTANSTSEVEFKVAPFAPPTVSTNDRPSVSFAFPSGGMEQMAVTERIQLDLIMRVGADAPSNAAARSFTVYIYYTGNTFIAYSGSFTSASTSGGYRYYTGSFEFTREMLIDAIGFIPVFSYYRTGTEVQDEFDISLAVTKFTLTMPTYLYEDIIGTGGPALPDDITPVPPPIYDDFNDFVVDEDQLMQDTDASQDFSDIYNQFTNAWSFVGPCLMYFIGIFDRFLVMDGLYILFQISLYLGLTAFILAVASTIVTVIRNKKE